MGLQRTVSGSINFDHGGFYEGDSTTIGYSGRVSITPRLGLEPNASVRWIDTRFGSFTTQQYRARLTYTFTPLMLVAGLVQYNTNSHTLGINLRLRWEYSPGSELFVVYTEDDNTNARLGEPSGLLNRGIVVKLNRLLRF